MRWFLMMLVVGCGGVDGAGGKGGTHDNLTTDVECWGYFSEAGLGFEDCGDIRACCTGDASECWWEDDSGKTVYECVSFVCADEEDSNGLANACGPTVLL